MSRYDRWIPALKKFVREGEGLALHLYLDVNRYLTIGVGHNADTNGNKDLLLLPYYKKRLRVTEYYERQLTKYLSNQSMTTHLAAYIKSEKNKIHTNLEKFLFMEHHELDRDIEDYQSEFSAKVNEEIKRIQEEEEKAKAKEAASETSEETVEKTAEELKKEEAEAKEKLKNQIISFSKNLDEPIPKNFIDRITSMQSSSYETWEVFLEKGKKAIELEGNSYKPIIQAFNRSFMEAKPHADEIKAEAAAIKGVDKNKVFLSQVYEKHAALFLTKGYAVDILFPIDLRTKLIESKNNLNDYKGYDGRPLPLKAIVASIDIAFRRGATGFVTLMPASLSKMRSAVGKQKLDSQLKQAGLYERRNSLGIRELILANMWEAAAAVSSISSSQARRNREVRNILLEVALEEMHPTNEKERSRLGQIISGETAARKVLSSKIFPNFNELPKVLQKAIVQVSITNRNLDLATAVYVHKVWNGHPSFRAGIGSFNYYKALKNVPKKLIFSDQRNAQTKAAHAHLKDVIENTVIPLQKKSLRSEVIKNYASLLKKLSNAPAQIKNAMKELQISESEFKSLMQNTDATLKFDQGNSPVAITSVIVEMIMTNHGRLQTFSTDNAKLHQTMRQGNWDKSLEYAKGLKLKEGKVSQLNPEDVKKLEKAYQLILLTRGNVEGLKKLRNTAKYRELPRSMKGPVTALVYFEGEEGLKSIQTFLKSANARHWKSAALKLKESSKNYKKEIQVHLEVLEKEAWKLAIQNRPELLAEVRAAYSIAFENLANYEKWMATLKLDQNKITNFIPDNNKNYRISLDKDSKSSALLGWIEGMVVAEYDDFQEFVENNKSLHEALTKGEWKKASGLVKAAKPKAALLQVSKFVQNYNKLVTLVTFFPKYASYPLEIREALAVYRIRGSLSGIKARKKFVENIKAGNWGGAYNAIKDTNLREKYINAFAKYKDVTTDLGAAAPTAIPETKKVQVKKDEKIVDKKTLSKTVNAPENKDIAAEIRNEYKAQTDQLAKYAKELVPLNIKQEKLTGFIPDKSKNYSIAFDANWSESIALDLIVFYVISKSDNLQNFIQKNPQFHSNAKKEEWWKLSRFFKKAENQQVFKNANALRRNHQRLTTLHKLFKNFAKFPEDIRLALATYSIRGSVQGIKKQKNLVKEIIAEDWVKAYKEITDTIYLDAYKNAFGRVAAKSKELGKLTPSSRNQILAKGKPLPTAQVEALIRKALKTPRYRQLALETTLNLQEDFRRKRRPKMPSTLPSQVKSVVEEVWAQMA